MLPIYGSFVFSCNKLISNTIPRAVCSRRVFVVTHDLQPCAALGHSRRLVPGVGPVEDDSDLIGQQRPVGGGISRAPSSGPCGQRRHDLRHGRALPGEVDAHRAEPTYGPAKYSELVSFCNYRTRCSRRDTGIVMDVSLRSFCWPRAKAMRRVLSLYCAC
jgi:hypothetical protein